MEIRGCAATVRARKLYTTRFPEPEYHTVPGQVPNGTWQEFLIEVLLGREDFFMDDPKRMRPKIAVITVIFAIAVLMGNIALGLFLWQRTNVSSSPEATSVTKQQSERLSYKGEKEKDAFTLLKEKATVEQDTSGLVVSINDQRADVAKREYWAFYVNGKLASVGPADYQTKDGDRIEWKIDRY